MRKATKVASNAMIYHQAFVEKSAMERNWDLGPITRRIAQQAGPDTSDESSDEEKTKVKLSKEKIKKLMEGIHKSSFPKNAHSIQPPIKGLITPKRKRRRKQKDQKNNRERSEKYPIMKNKFRLRLV